MVWLAGSAVAILLFSEIAAIVLPHRANRLRRVSLWCAVPVLVLFAVAWLLQIQAMVSQAS